MKKCLLIGLMLLGIGVWSLGLVPVSFAQTDSSEYRTQYNSPQEYMELTGQRITKFNESPELKIKVAAGEIPSVEERLPENPIVVVPIEEVGQYGGNWNRPCFYIGWVFGSTIYEPLVRWAKDAVNTEPNIVERWDFPEDRKSLTLFLRKGIKWSDGHLFTAEDIMFWYEDIFLNENLTPVKPKTFVVQDTPVKFEKIDDFTVKLSFAGPYVFALQELSAAWLKHEYPFAPKHYLKQFHPDYASIEDLEAMAKEEKFEKWYQLFAAKANYLINTELPTVFPWKIKDPSWGGIATLERNPYYWKVDTAGNQLPYIDNIKVVHVADDKIAGIKALAGEWDMWGRGVDLADYTLYKKNEDEGEYRLLLYPDTVSVHPALELNQTVKDPVLRKLFRDIRFRRAVSLSINREEINEIVFSGLLPIAQATPSLPTTPFYKEEFTKSYVEHDPGRANQILDEMGLKWDKNQEWRLRSDGEILEILFFTRHNLEWMHTGELVGKYLETIGIKSVVQLRDWGIMEELYEANEFEGTLIGGQTDPLMLDVDSVFFLQSPYGNFNTFAPEWAHWVKSGGKSGEKPVEEVVRMLELYERYKTTINSQERNELGEEILRIHSENLWVIGLGGFTYPRGIIAKNNFRNLPPENTQMGYVYGLNGYSHPEQYFIKK